MRENEEEWKQTVKEHAYTQLEENGASDEKADQFFESYCDPGGWDFHDASLLEVTCAYSNTMRATLDLETGDVKLHGSFQGGKASHSGVEPTGLIRQGKYFDDERHDDDYPPMGRAENATLYFYK